MDTAKISPAGRGFPFPAPLTAPRRIYPVFLPFAGCGERCVFCAQDIQTGRSPSAPEDTLRTAAADLAAAAEKGLPAPELAFFGGTFTAQPPDVFAACLRFGENLRGRGLISALRCSTRPDAVSGERLKALAGAGFSLVELGVQTFSDPALSASRRGYSGREAAEGCARVRKAGLELGVQLLPGLPGHAPADMDADVAQTLALGPACVRLYPCLVLEGTALAGFWRAGLFRPWSLEDAVEALARSCLRFWRAGVPVIRMGLAEEPGLAEHVLDGPRHPSLGSMVRGLALHYYLQDAVRAFHEGADGISGTAPAGAAAARAAPERLPLPRQPAGLRLLAPRHCQGEFWGWKKSLVPLYAALGLTPERVQWVEGEEFYLLADTPGPDASGPDASALCLVRMRLDGACVYEDTRSAGIPPAAKEKMGDGMEERWIARGREVLGIEIEALQSVRDRLGEPFARAVDLLAGCSGRVIVTGIGKSGLVGRKIAATLSSTGTPSYFLHPVEGAHGDLGAVRPGDVVLAISYSGRTDELNAILPALRSLGAAIIALTSGLTSGLAELADVVIDCGVPREACSMNMVPTSSTTATLALGDALAMCLMDGRSFTRSDFGRYHPGGALGQRLSLRVADLMHDADLPLANDTVSLEEALTVMDGGGLGAVMLTDAAGRLSGILTDGDVRRLLCRGELDLRRGVSGVMTAQPCFARPDMSVAELMDMMEARTITVLPVLRPDHVVAGIVHLHDLLGKGQIRFAPPAR